MKRFLKFLLGGVMLIGICITWIYLTAERRGERAWNDFKQEMAAKGESMDMETFTPKPVPDDQNMMAAPIFQKWFSPWKTVKTTSRGLPIKIPEAGVIRGNYGHQEAIDLPELLALLYDNTNVVSPVTNEIMPLISVEEAPLPDALHTVARQCGFDLSPDPQLLQEMQTNPFPSITFRWEHVTMRQALDALLDNNELVLVSLPTNNPASGLQPALYRRKSEHEKWLSQIKQQIEINASANSFESYTNGKAEVVTQIVIGKSRLGEAIKTLARMGGISFQFGYSLEAQLQDVVIDLSTNASPKQALLKILDENQLLIHRASPEIFTIVRRRKTAAEIMKEFETFDDELQELYVASKRPYAQLPFDSKSVSSYTNVPNFMPYRTLAQSLTLRASAELALRKPDAAFVDVKCCLRMAEGVGSHPSLIGAMIQTALDGLAVQPVWEGCASHQWNDLQLAEFEQIFSRIDLIAGALRAIRADRAGGAFARLKMSPRELSRYHDYSAFLPESKSRYIKRKTLAFVPKSWLYENAIVESRICQEANIDPVDPRDEIISPSKLNLAATKASAQLNHLRPSTLEASLGEPIFSRVWQCVAYNQSCFNEARIGFALERYRLAHGIYPARLDLLVPQFLRQIPRDVINGEPLKYRINPDGQFILYSVGWNEKDDGGQAVDLTDQGKPGDWVWQYPSQN